MTINDTNDGASTVFTLHQVNQHDHPDDLWIIIDNNVYDVTSFIKDESHPGGAEVIIECGGSDATEAFDDVAHSDHASDMLEPYYIGQIIKDQQKPYTSVRRKLKEAEDRMKQKKLEKHRLAKERKRQKHYKHIVDNLTIFLLLLLVIGTIFFYVILQHFKRNYYEELLH